MSLSTDDRARVPFALVGVLLLVSSTAYTGVLATQTRTPDRTPAERATATAKTAAHANLEQAALQATEAVGQAPLTVAADTPMGRVLQGPDTFERYLRLQIYLYARRALSNTSATAGTVTVTPTLPRIRNPADARDAISRTTIRPVDDGRRVRVVLENVSFRRTTGGEPTGTTTTNVSVVVASPILDLHRRTSRYETRLNNGPIEGPGLGRRVTAGLTLTAQARGFGQYYELPIENVLPNRHVELQANVAATTLQQDAFGRTDPESVGALGWAVARVGLRDGVAAMSVGEDRWSERVLEQPPAATPSAAAAALEPPASDQSRSDRTVDLEPVATRALVDVAADDRAKITRAVDAAYTIDARLVTDTHHVSRTTERSGQRPARGILVTSDTRTSREASPAGTGHVSTPAGFELVETSRRRVVTTHRTTRVWRTATETTRTVETTTTVTMVDAGVATSYTPAPAPDRPVAASKARLRLDAAAVDSLLGSSTQRDALAERIASGDAVSGGRSISIEPPAAVRKAAWAAVLDTHRRTRNLTAQTARPVAPNGTPSNAARTDSLATRTGTGALARRVEENRTRLLAVPDRYTGPAAVGRTAARQAYLHAVTEELDADRSNVPRMQSALAGVLADWNVSVPDPASEPTPSRSPTGVSVDVTPSYLPVTEVTPRMADVDETYHPLAARNVNLFTVPSSDVADTVSSAVDGSPPTSSVDVAIAAQTLHAASNDSIPENDSLVIARDGLRDHVTAATDHLEHAQVRELSRTTPLSSAASEDIVTGVHGRYATVAGRALATTNGTTSQMIADEAAARYDVDRALLAARLRVVVDRARTKQDGRVPEAASKRTAALTRDVLQTGLQRLVEHGVEDGADRLKRRALSKKMAQLPAGLPVLPVPGSWYLTVNVWIVDVRGAYHRVEARSVVASPSFGDDGLAYVREARPVRVDVDGDGTPEQLGRVEPVAFSVQTAIVVAVPPGPSGVGDTDGNADERSPGWPGPPAAVNETDTGGRNETETTPPSPGSP